MGERPKKEIVVALLFVTYYVMEILNKFLCLRFCQGNPPIEGPEVLACGYEYIFFVHNSLQTVCNFLYLASISTVLWIDGVLDGGRGKDLTSKSAKQ